MRPYDPTPDGFCALAWDHTADLQQAICAHPFNLALAEGTLDRERFAFYLVQDARYLVGFARALAAGATRAPDAGEGAFFAGAAHTALTVEASLHRDFLDRYGWTGEEVAAVPTTPSGLAYASYLQAAALSEPYEVLVATLLPCFWVYAHVGDTILDQTRDVADHPYQAWVHTYADEDFARSVAAIQGIVERAAAATDASTRAAMLVAFTRASEYEWLNEKRGYSQAPKVAGKGMDAVSIGPEIRNAHSPDEMVQISSVQKFYRHLTALLADLA